MTVIETGKHNLYLSSVLTGKGLSLQGFVWAETSYDAEHRTRCFLKDSCGPLADVCCILQNSTNFTENGQPVLCSFVIGPDLSDITPPPLLVKKQDGKDVPFPFDEKTPFGEPQVWIPMSDGTSVEITRELDSLPLEKQFYSVRRHCSQSDIDNLPADSTGVIATWTAASYEKLQQLVTYLMDVMARQNGIYPMPAESEVE